MSGKKRHAGPGRRLHGAKSATGGIPPQANPADTVAQAGPFAISLAAASKHIKVLENAGLIRREVRGRTHLCRLEPGPLASAFEWLSFYERFWTDRLDVLERLLRQDEERSSPTPKGDEP